MRKAKHNSVAHDEQPQALDTLGLRLIELRERKGLTLTQASKAAKVSRAFLWELETRRSSNPSKKTCQKLANLYGVSVQELLAVGSPSPRTPVISKQQMSADFDCLPIQQQQEVAALVHSMAQLVQQRGAHAAKQLTRPRKEHAPSAKADA